MDEQRYTLELGEREFIFKDQGEPWFTIDRRDNFEVGAQMIVDGLNLLEKERQLEKRLLEYFSPEGSDTSLKAQLQEAGFGEGGVL